MTPLLAVEIPHGDFVWWVCGVLAAANATQYIRDWRRELRYQKEIAKRDAALAEAQDRNRRDLLTMQPVLIRVLDWLNQS